MRPVRAQIAVLGCLLTLALSAAAGPDFGPTVRDFAANRHQLVQDLATRLTLPLPPEVESFFQAAEAGDWPAASNQLAQLNYSGIEYHLNRAFGYATGFVTPLNDKGEQVWPKAGDAASFNLLPASCSAEAVARLPERTAVFHKGRLAAGGLDKVA